MDPGAVPPIPAGQGQAAERLAYLFRHTLAAGRVNPLLPIVQRELGLGGIRVGALGTKPAPAIDFGSAKIAESDLHKNLSDLPSLPQAVLDAMALLRDDDSGTSELTHCIERDQALAARTLRIANSAFYGVPGRVASIRNAIDLMGRRAVANMVTSCALSAQFDAASCPDFDYRGFWNHSIAAAMAGRDIARALRLDDDTAFTAGLLHDIGRLALAVRFPGAMEQALAHAREADLLPLDAERQVLGIDHVTAGIAVATHWRFPREVVAAIEGHHEPATPAGGKPDLADVVHVANALAHALDLAGDPREAVPPVDLAAWARVGLPGAAIQSVLTSTRAGLKEVCEALLR